MPSLTLKLAVPAALLFSAAAAAPVFAQDTRAVTEPVFPAACSTVTADLSISAGEPSSELNTAHDTSIIQAALVNAKANCAQGTAVELVASGNLNAFVIAPIYIPAGITLLVDGGVTLFGSRNATDYQNSSSAVCGSNDSGNGCNPLITVGQSSVNGTSNTYYTTTQATTGVMGYGIINGRGQDKLITLDNQANPTTYTVGPQSWWDIAVPGTEDNPVMLMSYKTANVTLYKITLLNSPHFHVRVTGQGNLTTSKYNTNFTVWGLKLITPWTPHNTDGVDPSGTNNVSVLNSIIGDGDDEIAVSGSSTGSNLTFSNLLLPSGHGVSIGSITTNGVSNMAVSNINFSGQPADGNQIALRIKSYCGSGGAVTNVAYSNVCMRNVATGLDLDPFYSTSSSTTSCPSFGTAAAPISFTNIFLNTANAKINLQGLNAATPSYITLDNIYNNAATLNLRVQQSNDTTATPAYDNITLNDGYYPAAWGTLNTAANAVSVNETNNGTPAAAFPTAYCANAFPLLNGELFASISGGGATSTSVNRATTVAGPATVTLNAVVQPVNSTTTFGAYTGTPVPTGSVQFLDGSAVVGTAALGVNGALTTLTLTNVGAGPHSYTANYLGDGNYAATPFGTSTYTGTQNGAVPAPTALVVTVTGAAASQLGFTQAPPTSLTYGNAPGTVTVAVRDGGGNITASNANVTLTVAGPNNYSQAYTATASNGTATFNLTASLPGVGNYNYVASSTGLTASPAATEAVTPATLTVSATAASRAFGQANPPLTYTVTGFVNGDPATVVSGTPALGTNAMPNSPAGNYAITVMQGSLAAANYVFATNGNFLTVTGSSAVAQQIRFAALSNFTSGQSYQLTARTTSGLAVSYTVTGPATVTGSTLTVNSPGQVTVTAASTGDADYAAAQSVSRTFTAQ